MLAFRGCGPGHLVVELALKGRPARRGSWWRRAGSRRGRLRWSEGGLDHAAAPVSAGLISAGSVTAALVAAGVLSDAPAADCR